MVGKLKRFVTRPFRQLAAIQSELEDQTKLLDARMQSVIAGLDNQSQMLAERLNQVVQGMDNHSQLLAHKLEQIIQGIDHQASLMNERFDQLRQGLDNQSKTLTAQLGPIKRAIDRQPHLVGERIAEAIRTLDRARFPTTARNIDTTTVPDFQFGDLEPEQFRELLLHRGAVMLRKATDPALLDLIKQKIDGLFAQYESAPEMRSGTYPATISSNDLGDFWYQLRRSHIFEQTFKQLSGSSYYDIIRGTGLWDFAAHAFPEYQLAESIDCNCRRVTTGDLPVMFDAPVDFHVDAQYHSIYNLSVNFWTPLAPCGRDAPGLQVVLLGIEETKDYLEFDFAGYDAKPNDIANMRHFRCYKEQLEQLKQNDLAKCLWAPEFEKGDILAFTNFTMHATYCTPEMTNPRTSVEVRITCQ